MLRDEVARYTELTGEDGWHVPIMKIGAYLDGYNKGLEALGKIRAEIADYDDLIGHNAQVQWCLKVIDKYKAESEDGVCKDCYYNDGEVHAECVICDKAGSEG